ncbi:PREDICTED: uncharacterized protein At4g00950-like [Lupinus angustifolius]|uniref:uncharacterized protein At4g00950-like n=1 Tax=Lupinus angustifolius TaxID=3871 RepID=UPI00092EA880|nr:PREDICTED: uncharacterized protein At4g00950-like [Lupinus angustifolius]
MGSKVEVDEEHSKIPKLPLFSIPPMKSPEKSGMKTPPFHASVSVPFDWEQEPGKPRPCNNNSLITFSNNIPKCLELPPRLLLPSPTTVLEGPYVEDSSRITNRFHSPPSFRIINEEGVLGSMILTKGGEGIKHKGWWFGCSRKRVLKMKRDISFDKESSNKKVNMPKMKHSKSFFTMSHDKSHLWATICEGLKQVVPSWRSKKLKKVGSDFKL